MMKALLLFTFLFPMTLLCQSISINSDGSNPDPSAILDLKSSDKGLLIPRTDTSSITSPSNGLMIYQISDDAFYFYNGSRWNGMYGTSPVPNGTIVLSDTFPNQALENDGFNIYGSYEETFTDLSEDTINYGEWSFLGNTAPVELIGEKTLWTGSELLIWGGNSDTKSNFGAKYDPITNIWTTISTTNAPSARRNFACVWTGTKMLIFGGETDTGLVNDMFEYDPTNDNWTEIIGSNPPSGRKVEDYLWVGDVLFIYGITNGNTFVPEGYFYDLSSNNWKTIALLDAPDRGTLAFADNKLFVYGGGQGTGYPSCSFAGVPNKYYDINTGTWNIYLSSVKRLSPNTLTLDSFIYLFGGYGYTYTVDHGGIFGGGSCITSGTESYGMQGKYNTSNSSINNAFNNSLPGPKGSGGLTQMVYTGEELIYWGFNNGIAVGMTINPLNNENTIISTVNAPPLTYNYYSVWANDQMLVWEPSEGLYAFDPSAKGVGPIEVVTKTMYMYKKN